MYFQVKVIEKISEKQVCFSDKTMVQGAACPYLTDSLPVMAAGEIACDRIVVEIGIPDDIRERIGEKYAANRDGYAILTGKTTRIYAETMQGVFHAAATLRQLYDSGELCEVFLYDCPVGEMRGYRAFVPGRFEFDAFRRTVDMLAYYKYNMIMIQVSGAMEYKRHPEINETMERVVKELKEAVDGAAIAQKKYNRATSGYHPANGGGSYITQEEMKELIDYCRSRGLEVIPEVPSLSHCEYLATSHPEIKEDRRDVRFPLAYCPSNPYTYELLFDVLDEVIDVFEPRYINIGHDEFYSMALCDRCKDKDPKDLFAGDINKIHDYLAGKNIRTMMWGDHLLNVWDGAGYNEPGDWDYVPPLYECIDMLPKDIVMLNWYYCFGPWTDHRFKDHGFDHLYGNFHPVGITDFKTRSVESKYSGCLVSNWGPYLFDTMQRNHQFSDIVLGAYMVWCDDYTDDRHREQCELSAKEEYRYSKKYWKSQYESVITITHTTDYFAQTGSYFKDGNVYSDERCKLGAYIVFYGDGTTAQLPVKYGFNISNMDCSYDNNRSLYHEVSPTATQEKIDGKVYYTHEYENPYPEKNIMGISFYKTRGAEFSVFVKSIEF